MDVMNISEELISFETAKLAKEKGFDIITNQHYNEKLTSDIKFTINTGYYSLLNVCDYSIPTQSLLQRWLREVHKIHVNVLPRYHPEKLKTEDVLFSYSISIKENDYDGNSDNLNHWIGIHVNPFIPDLFYHICETYELAFEQGLQEGLKLIKI